MENINNSIENYSSVQRFKYISTLHAKNASTITKFENEVLKNERYFSSKEKKALGLVAGEFTDRLTAIKLAMNEMSAFLNRFGRERIQELSSDRGDSKQ